MLQLTPFTPEEAKTIIQDCIENGTKHADYSRVCALRRDYLTILTGSGYESFLTRFIRREGTDEFRQRLDLTYQNLTSIASPLVKKFGQISRVQDLKKGIDFVGTSDRDQKDLTTVLSSFGAIGSSRQGSLDDYLSITYDLVALYDPNAFVVLDFESFNSDAGQRAKPYGVLYESNSILNYRYTAGHLDYVLVSLSVNYTDTDNRKQTVTDYILYSSQFAYRYFFNADGRVDLPTVYNMFNTPSGSYYVTEFNLGLKETPAVRLGYLPDMETAGRTCVSPLFHPALDLFKEAINLKSQSDLITRLHGFPKRYEYAPTCDGEVSESTGLNLGCSQGKTMTGETCRKCGGTGYLVHATEQDVVRLPLPRHADELLQLNQLVHVDKPDVDTLQEFEAKLEKLQSRIYLTTFSTDYQLKTSGVTAVAQTATEVSITRQDENNTLLPWADGKSAVYKALVRHIAAVMNISGEVKPLYEYPRDLKLSTLAELYADLKAARDAGVPSFEIEKILDDIARKRYESDPVALQRYFIQKQHIPYLALSLAEFEYFDSTGRIPSDMALLKANSDIIFGELEQEQPMFYELPYAQRDQLVSDKVAELQAQMPRTVNLSSIVQGGQSQQQA